MRERGRNNNKSVRLVYDVYYAYICTSFATWDRLEILFSRPEKLNRVMSTQKGDLIFFTDN